MLLDSNKGNTCAAVANPMMYNNNAIFTPTHHGQHNINPMMYTNMACSTGGESSTTSSVSSSQTRLLQFDNPDLTINDMTFNPNMPIDQVEDLEPMARDRSNTWPLRRQIIETQTSPLIHEQIPGRLRREDFVRTLLISAYSRRGLIVRKRRKSGQSTASKSDANSTILYFTNAL
jgi:hypothetical protein